MSQLLGLAIGLTSRALMMTPASLVCGLEATMRAWMMACFLSWDALPLACAISQNLLCQVTNVMSCQGITRSKSCVTKPETLTTSHMQPLG